MPDEPQSIAFAHAATAPNLLEREPVAVFLGGLATTVGIVLGTLAGFGVIDWSPAQITSVELSIGTVTTLIILTQRAMVVSPATADQRLANVIEGTAIELTAEPLELNVDDLAAALAPALAEVQRHQAELGTPPA